MPRVSPDLELSRILADYVRERHSGNKARASETLSITRPVLYRALRGCVTKTTGEEIRAKLKSEVFAPSVSGVSHASAAAPVSEAMHDIPTIALQVLRFMTQAVQHERSPDRTQPDA